MCHFAALVSVEEEEGGGEESWEDEVDEGKKWLVSQPAADVAHCGKQEVSARFGAAPAEHMDSCTVENHTNQRAHRMNPMLRRTRYSVFPNRIAHKEKSMLVLCW